MNYDKKVFKRWSRFPISWKSSKHFRFTAAYIQENLLCDLLYRIVLTFQNLADIVFFMSEKIKEQLKKVLYTYFQIVFSISGFIISSLILSLKTKSDFFANGKIKAEISFAGNLFGTCSLFIYMLYHCVKTEKYLIFNTCYIILVSKF